MSLPMLIFAAVMPLIAKDHIEFLEDRDRAAVSILHASTPTARDELIHDIISQAASLGPGKESSGFVVGSQMKYQGFDAKDNSYVTAYYSDQQNEKATFICQIRSSGPRYSAFRKAMQWCASKLGLKVPPPFEPAISDDRGLLPAKLKDGN